MGVFDIVKSLVSSILQVTWVESKSSAIYLPQTASLLNDKDFPDDIRVRKNYYIEFGFFNDHTKREN